MKLSLFHGFGISLGFSSQPVVAGAPPLARSSASRQLTSARPIWPRGQIQRRTLALTAVGVLLGVILVAQWHSPLGPAAIDGGSRDQATQRTIGRLETEQTQLKKQIADLRSQMSAEQRTMSTSAASLKDLGNALAEQQMLAGTVPVKGQGIEILLDDSSSHQLLPSDDPDNYIVHEYQIRDIVNVLWGAGASAISVNDERFVNSTSVYCVGSTILINDTRTSPPYHIRAVGDSTRLQQAIDDGNNLRDLKARSQIYGVVLKVVRTGPTTVPAFNGSIAMKHTGIAYTDVSSGS